MTNANAQSSTYTYDVLNRPLTARNAANETFTYTYDGNGNVTQVRKPDTATIGYTYDGAGRLTAKGSVQYGYDASGRRTSMIDTTGTTTYGWDNASRLTSVTAPVTGTVSYLYDGAGRKTRITYPSGRQVTYSYNTRGELATVNGGTTLGTTTYTYDTAGRLTGIVVPNGVNSTLSYDAADRLLSIGHVKSGGVSQTFSYTYDASGNRLTATDPSGTTTYTYDNLNQLRTVQQPGGGGTTTYNFDAVGNRIEEISSAGTTSYTYDAANRVRTRTAPGGGTTSYTYDANGNRTGTSDSSGLTTYAYNVFDQLTSITGPNNVTVGQYVYNGDGLRTRKTVGTTTTNYAWDIAGDLPNVISDGDDYVWGQGLVGRVQPAQGMTPEVATYAHQDGLGSIRLLTDGMGADVGTQQYDPYGAPLAGTGITLPFGFTGEQQDAESGLVYLRARYMDPATGQFLTQDPWRGTKTNPLSQHGYSYAANNPIRWSDPSGLAPNFYCYHWSCNGEPPFKVTEFFKSIGCSITNLDDCAHPIWDKLKEAFRRAFGPPYDFSPQNVIRILQLIDIIPLAEACAGVGLIASGPGGGIASGLACFIAEVAIDVLVGHITAAQIAQSDCNVLLKLLLHGGNFINLAAAFAPIVGELYETAFYITSNQIIADCSV